MLRDELSSGHQLIEENDSSLNQCDDRPVRTSPLKLDFSTSKMKRLLREITNNHNPPICSSVQTPATESTPSDCHLQVNK